MLISNKIFQSLIFFCCLINTSCLGKNDSENSIIYQTTDYEGIKNAILFIKSGGATVGDSYHISILPYQNKLNNSDTGNILICDDPGRGLRADTSMIKMKWVSYDTLKVSYNKGLRVFKAITKYFCCNKSSTIIVYEKVNQVK